MKLLCLTPQFPYPPHQGTTIRNFNLLAGLAKHHAIHLFSFASLSSPWHQTPVHAFCADIHTVPVPPSRSIRQRLITTLLSTEPDMAFRLPSPAFQAQLRQQLASQTFDVIQIEGLEMALYALMIRAQLDNHRPTVPAARRSLLVYDAHNAEHILQRRAFETDARRPMRWPGAVYSFIQWLKLRRYEARVLRAMDRVITVSEGDARALQQLVPELRPIVVPNGVDIDYYVPGGSTSQPVKPLTHVGSSTPCYSLVFTGKMDFRPNVDAVVWFCNEILPRIRASQLHTQLVIVGRDPNQQVRALGRRPDVVVTGYVGDVRPYVAGASVYVAPLRMGSGTRLKILEAMAMGKAIVSTRVGAEGIACQSGRHLLLADNPDDFADAVLTLLADDQRRAELGRHARTLVEKQYAWDAIVARMEQVYDGHE